MYVCVCVCVCVCVVNMIFFWICLLGIQHHGCCLFLLAHLWKLNFAAKFKRISRKSMIQLEGAIGLKMFYDLQNLVRLDAKYRYNQLKILVFK